MRLGIIGAIALNSAVILAAENFTPSAESLSDAKLPTISPLQAANFRKMEFAEKRTRQIEADAEKIREISQNFSPDALTWLTKIINDETHPYAASALEIIAKQRSLEARQTLISALDNPRIDLQVAAFRALMKREKSPEIARKFLRSPDARLRAEAIAACGEYHLRELLPELRASSAKVSPPLRIAIAGAICQIDSSAPERDLLEQIGLSDDAVLATSAITTLAIFQDERAAGYAFARLQSPWQTISAAAAKNLRALPKVIIDRVLQSREIEEQHLLLARFAVVFFLQTTNSAAEKIPETAVAYLAQNGGRDDKKLVLAVWRRHPQIARLPLLIGLLDDAPRELSETVVGLLAACVQQNSALLSPPRDYHSADAWRSWWFRQFRVLAATSTQALLQIPDGDTRIVRLLDALDFGAEIIAITAGKGESGEIGGKVELTLDDARFIIQSAL